ncbi:MAG: hypothetical protein JXB07_05275 [Anaerolineae bacterium]|nr:hypothetical protein [Anaerolineae bacterium]
MKRGYLGALIVVTLAVIGSVGTALAYLPVPRSRKAKTYPDTYMSRHSIPGLMRNIPRINFSLAATSLYCVP